MHYIWPIESGHTNVILSLPSSVEKVKEQQIDFGLIIQVPAIQTRLLVRLSLNKKKYKFDQNGFAPPPLETTGPC